MAEDKKQYLVLNLRPRADQASKPSELIQVTGHQDLTLNARRSITLLWHNAHRQGVEIGKDYTIEIDDLCGTHKGYERVEEAVIALMQTIITISRPDGSTRRVQFLGGNDMDDPSRPAGTLTYSFDKRLVEVLKDSTIWGKISLPVVMALSSKYAISLYENVAQWTGLNQKIGQTITLEEFRELIGISDGKYSSFGGLNKHVVKPMIQEINALAPFLVTVLPVKTGKKVTHIKIGWVMKSQDDIQRAYQELARTKIGRRARIQNQVELVLDPSPSENRIVKRGRKHSPDSS